MSEIDEQVNRHLVTEAMELRRRHAFFPSHLLGLVVHREVIVADAEIHRRGPRRGRVTE